jgi:hypothetical protein
MDKHGHFIVIALLKCGSDDIRKGVLEELVASAPKLGVHNTSATVVDYMFASGTPTDRLRILSSFFGREYVPTPSIAQHHTASYSTV